jgi:exonuclease III
LRESRAKNRSLPAKQFENLSFQNFKISGKNSKKINGYKISKNSPAFATIQKESLRTLERESRAKNCSLPAKQFEILSFQNFKISGKNFKKINGYKISKNSAAFATLQKESLWTLEGIQSKNRSLSAKQFEILSFQNFKISGKNYKKINVYKISKNSAAFATLQIESLWTLEGIQSKNR